jgi:outer membrane protein assembly factor BamB
VVALRTATGDEAWRFEDPALQSTWSTPALVRRAEGGAELLLAVPGQAWGFDPGTGRRLWSCGGTDPNSACASLISEHGVAYAVVGRRGGSALAIRTGGEGDVAKSHVVWSKNIAGSVGTPVVHGGLIYSFAGGMAECIDAATGESLVRKRLGGAAALADPAVQRTAAVALPEDRAFSAAEPSTADAPERADRRAAPESEPSRGASSAAGPAADRGRNFEDGGRGGRGGERGFGRGGRGGRSQDYASPVVADGKVYFVRRSGEAFVFAVGPALEQLAVNRFSGDADFSATPAIADGEIYLRSSEKLYCVAADDR